MESSDLNCTMCNDLSKSSDFLCKDCITKIKIIKKDVLILLDNKKNQIYLSNVMAFGFTCLKCQKFFEFNDYENAKEHINSCGCDIQKAEKVLSKYMLFRQKSHESDQNQDYIENDYFNQKNEQNSSHGYNRNSEKDNEDEKYEEEDNSY